MKEWEGRDVTRVLHTAAEVSVGEHDAWEGGREGDSKRGQRERVVADRKPIDAAAWPLPTPRVSTLRG